MSAEHVFVIPDSHGHLAEVEQLVGSLDSQGYLKDSKLVLLGDYVDRGPAVRQLIDYCIDLQKAGHVLLSGNHEYTLLRVLADGPDRDKWISRWGRSYESDTLASYGIPYNKEQTWTDRANLLRQAMPAEHLRFLQSLPWIWESDELIAVHAGLDPEVTIDEQRLQLINREHPTERGPSQLFSHELASIPAYDIGKIVVSGHASRFSPHFGPNRVLLDCGVDAGGPLVTYSSEQQKFFAVQQ